MKRLAVGLLTLLVFVVVACDGAQTPTPAPSPTPSVTPTTIMTVTPTATPTSSATETPTATSSSTPTATATPSATPTSVTTTPTVTPSPTPTPSQTPPVAVCPPNPGPPDPDKPSITVDTPADGTETASPLWITGRALVFEGQYNVLLLSATGEVLVDRPVFGGGPVATEPTPYEFMVAFDVAAPTQACLEVFDVSEADGSMIDVVQREIMLLPGAERAGGACPRNLTPPDFTDPDIGVTLPPDLWEASGGALHVEGSARVFEAAVSLRVLAADGREILSASIAADAGAPEKAPFAGDLAYAVDRPTSACLQVYSLSPRDGSIENLVQRELLLQP